MDIHQLKHDLKRLIIEECEKDLDPSLITTDEALIGGQLQLDSLDVLQACMAIKHKYGVRIEGSSAARKAFANIDTLAATISAARTG